MKRFLAFFREAYQEISKAIWPSRKNVLSHTLIVLGVVAIVMLILVVVDSGLAKGVEALINISQKTK